DEGAGIEKDGESFGVKEVNELGSGGVDTVGMHVGDQGAGREDAIKRTSVGEGEDRSANGGIVVVCGGDGGDDEVIGIIATSEEDADEGLVVARADIGLGDGGVHEAEVADGRGEGGGADGSAGGLADEVAAGLEDLGRFL